MRKKQKFLTGWNMLLLAFCIVLFMILSGFLIWDYQVQSRESERLKVMADREQELYVPEEEEAAGR